jgi:GNAT superfamily N-acetyltransferase
MAKRITARDLAIRPLTAARVDDLKAVTAGTWGASCWCLFPRYTAKQRRERRVDASGDASRRAEMARLARRRHAPGLIAYRDGEPIGWIAIAPRAELGRVAASRATPPVDAVPVWVIPCITVRRGHRGEGVAVAMIRAAVDYAARLGAPAVEGYPRRTSARLHDDFLFIGNEAMFRRAGFREVRGVLRPLPKGWTPRVAMRKTLRTRGAPGERAPASARGATATVPPPDTARPRRSRRTRA